jgi:hypothetical protein
LYNDIFYSIESIRLENKIKDELSFYISFFFFQIEKSMTCQLRKRKRAISVDNLNEQKDDVSISENNNEISNLI